MKHLDTDDIPDRRRGKRRASAGSISTDQRADDRRTRKPGIMGLMRDMIRFAGRRKP